MNPETTPVIPRTESAPVAPDVERQYGNQEKNTPSGLILL